MVSEFYKLTFDDSNPDAVVCRKYELRGLNKYVVRQAKPVEAWPDNVTFYYNEGEPEDYLGNALGWLLLSDRVQQAVLRLGITSVQFLPVRVENERTGSNLSNYAVMNVLGVVAALDREHADYRESSEHPDFPVIFKPALRRDVISGLDIFRLREQMVLVFVSRRFKEQIEEAQATGFRFVPTPAY